MTGPGVARGGDTATVPPPGTRDAPTSALIEVQNVTHRFSLPGRTTTALEDIDLRIADGEFVVVLGPSGSGKTTLLRIIGGLIQPSEGTIRRRPRGEAPTSRQTRRRHETCDIGFVFQEPNLLPWRDALRNIELPLELEGRPKAERVERARHLLDVVKLQDFAAAYPRQLSGGMRQRVAIARAMVVDPEVLLMDEPFGALDAQTRDEMNLELQRLWLEQGKTVVFVTHSILEAVFLADRVVLLSSNPGRVRTVTSVDFPRPRPMALLDDPEFQRTVSALRAQLDHGK